MRYRWVALALAFLGSWAVSLISQISAPLAPLFQPELGITKAEVGMFTAANAAGQWLVVLFSGFLIDRYGIRRMMSFGLAVAGGFLVSMALVRSFPQAIAAMFAAGASKGFGTPGSTKAVLDWFPPHSRGTAMGIKQLGMPVASLLAAMTLPTVGLAYGWRTAMAAGGVMVIACAVAFALFYRDFPQSKARARELRIREGLSEMVRNKNLLLISAISLFMLAVQGASVTYLALYLNEVVLVDAIPDVPTRIVAAGGYLAVCQMGGVLGRVAWGIVSDRQFRGRRGPVVAIVSAGSIAMAVLMSGLGPSSPPWFVAVALFVLGTTAIGWNGVYYAMVSESVGRKYAGTGMGMNMFLTEGGNIAGPPLFGFVVDVTGSYSPAWLLTAFLAACGTVAAVAAARGEGQRDRV